MDTYRVTKNSKCFSEIDSLLIVIASIAISFEYKLKGDAIYNPGDFAVIEGLSSGKMIRLPLHGPVEAALNGLKPDVIEITIEDMKPSTKTYQVKTSALQKTINYIFSPYFIAFYENNYSEAKQMYGKDFSKWPASWRMGWAVRNALSHNRKVFYKDLTAEPIDWKGVVISPLLQNTPIETILNFTDMLLLLFDMESDLK